MNKTGEIIKELRKQKGLSQEELGKIIGVQKSAIAKYENGRVNNLKRTSIEKLAKFFGVSPTYIMGMDEPQKSLDEQLRDLFANNDFSTDEIKEINNYIKYLINKRGSENG